MSAPRDTLPARERDIGSCDECADGGERNCGFRVGPHREPMVFPCPSFKRSTPETP